MESETAVEQRKELYESWGFNQKSDLLDMLPKLYEGRAMNAYLKKLESGKPSPMAGKINAACGDKG